MNTIISYLNRQSGIAILSLLIGLSACSPKLHQTSQDAALYIIKDIPADSTVLALYKPYKLSIDSQMNAVIGTAAVNLERKKPEGLLNNLVADIMYQEGKRTDLRFDFVHTNYFGLRNSISAGPIKASKIYELMPFENYFVTVTLKGTDVQELFNYIAALNGDPVSGARFRIKDGKAVDIQINGTKFDPSKEYTVLTIDYMANGGDKAEVYTRAIRRFDSTYRLRDAILAYIKQQQAQGKTITSALDSRIQSDNDNSK
ncbi:5'-nucleotidase C-terminal domain-containing protein [Arcticibacter sp.]|uniref:5'-nucleotidase C-terminal domain-containing protein n=1 Tax=Arcticibacter sp. TaxID=1872630 RepID=UPI003890A57B